MSLLLPSTPDFLRLQAQRRGGEGGLFFGGRHIVYGELAAAVDELAHWLAKRGIGGGHRLGIMAANEPALVAATFAVWGLGAVAVPIGVRSTARETGVLLERSQAAALLCDAVRAQVAREAAAAAGIPAFACEAELPLRPRALRRASVRPASPRTPVADSLAVLAYTSGTTGAPKGVMINHGNLLWSALACADRARRPAASVGACLSPLTHTPVFVSHLLCRMLPGASAVLIEKFDVDQVLEAVERFRHHRPAADCRHGVRRCGAEGYPRRCPPLRATRSASAAPPHRCRRSAPWRGSSTAPR